MKQVIRITEAQLRNIIKKSAERVLRETYNQFSDSEGLGWTDGDYNDELDDKYGRYDGVYNTRNYGPVRIVDYDGDIQVHVKTRGTLRGYAASTIKNEIDRLVFCLGFTIEGAVDKAVTDYCDKHKY